MWLLSKVSLPHFVRHATRTGLTLLGVAVGVAAMVATSSVTDAVLRAFRHGVEAVAGSAQVVISNGTAGVPEDLAAAIAAVPGVITAAPVIGGFVPLAGAEGQVLAVFGLDVLTDEEHEAQLPRSAVHVPDELLFVSRLDSIALARPFAERGGYALDSTVEVQTPHGLRSLVVRGLIDAVGPASLFGGMVGLMDLPAAQRLLGAEGRIDRIDVRLREGTSGGQVVEELRALVHGRGQVDDVAVHGARAGDLLFSVRVMLTLAALIAVVVGYFLIHHTVWVSVLQRRREIAVLNASGVSRRALVLWLAAEACILGGAAGLVGYGIGFLVAKWSLGSVGTVVTAFAQVPEPRLTVSLGAVGLATGIGVATTLVATLLACWSVLRWSSARLLDPGPAESAGHPWRMLAASAVGLVGTLGLITLAPRTLPYGPLVAFILTINALALVSVAFACPIAALLLGRALRLALGRGAGLGLLLASRSLVASPTAPVAVVTAIVLGLGATLADASLIESFRASWLGWLDQHYQSDLVVNAGAQTVSFLTSPPVSERVVEELRGLPDVAEAQGVRIVEVSHAGRPTAVQALDRSLHGLPLVDGTWERVAEAFWDGRGVAVNRQLAHLESLGAGSSVSLRTPSGERSFPILGVFTDFRVGYLGNIAMSRALYRSLWHDELVSSVRVWTAPGADVMRVREAVHRQFGSSHGLHAVTAGDFRRAVVNLTEHIFGLHYAIVLIALTVSTVGVTNFLLAAMLDRRPEFRTLTAAGVAAGQLARALVAEGTLLGLVGGALGLTAGALVSRIIVLHSVPMVNGWHFEFRFPIATAVRLFAGIVILAAAAGIFPALLASHRPSVPEDRRE